MSRQAEQAQWHQRRNHFLNAWNNGEERDFDPTETETILRKRVIRAQSLKRTLNDEEAARLPQKKPT